MPHHSVEYDPVTGLPNLISLFKIARNFSKSRGAFVVFRPYSLPFDNEAGEPRPADLHVHIFARNLQDAAKRVFPRTGVFRISEDEFAALLIGAGKATCEQVAMTAEQLYKQETTAMGLPSSGVLWAATSFPEEATSIGALIVDLHIKLNRRADTAESTRDAGAESTTETVPVWVEGVLNHLVRVFVETLDHLHKAQRMALTDTVSGLPNHRAAEAAVARLLTAYYAHGNRFSLLLIDGDNLKWYNELGYHEGNELIRKLGAVISESVRMQDLVARWLSGDEFLVILPDTGPEAARITGERLCQRVKSASKDWHFPVTISIGVASCPDDGLDWFSLVQAASLANQRAKQAGKDQVV